MTGVNVSQQVDVAPWAERFQPWAIRGSIYSVPRPQRLVAARALTAQQCGVHADIILDDVGRQRGVTWSELYEIRDRLPDAVIDLHLINLDTGQGADRYDAHTERALQAVVALQARAISMVPSQIRRHRRRLSRLRSTGHQVWAEIRPGMSMDQLDLSDIDGAMVMLIEPGTTDAADLDHLEKVANLSGMLPVCVDGGVTRGNASRCRAAGATSLVSGRGLLTLRRPATRTTQPKGIN